MVFVVYTVSSLAQGLTFVIVDILILIIKYCAYKTYFINRSHWIWPFDLVYIHFSPFFIPPVSPLNDSQHFAYIYIPLEISHKNSGSWTITHLDIVETGLHHGCLVRVRLGNVVEGVRRGDHGATGAVHGRAHAAPRLRLLARDLAVGNFVGHHRLGSVQVPETILILSSFNTVLRLNIN